MMSANINWKYVATLSAIHLLALLACWPWLFSWSGLALMYFGMHFYGLFGIDMGYHRLLTHRSFQCPLWFEHTLAVIGMCSAQDAPISWVATHRLHHQESDEESDPHTPRESFWWSHVGWLLVTNPKTRCMAAYERYARDLISDRFYRRLESPLPVAIAYFGHAALYGVGGLLVGGPQLAASWLVWGVVMRTVGVWHISWAVNSLTHLFGYRNFETRDDSRNNWIVAFWSVGEGWHNNHHRYPTSATNWFRWWEIDPVYIAICLLEKLGLVWNINRPDFGPMHSTLKVH